VDNDRKRRTQTTLSAFCWTRVEVNNRE